MVLSSLPSASVLRFKCVLPHLCLKQEVGMSLDVLGLLISVETWNSLGLVFIQTWSVCNLVLENMRESGHGSTMPSIPAPRTLEAEAGGWISEFKGLLVCRPSPRPARVT